MNDISQKKVHLNRWFWILALPVLVVLCLFAYHFLMVMTDGYGVFHSATDVADLDGDGNLDVLLHNVRQESEFTAFKVAKKVRLHFPDRRFPGIRPGPFSSPTWMKMATRMPL